MRLHRLCLFVTLLAAPLSCNPDPLPSGDDLRSGDGGGPCVGLACQVVDCEAQGKPQTTVSGVVTIPAGDLPLYGATVYVPNAAVPALPEGPACDRCGAGLPGDPIVRARTDVTGRFELKNVPVGQNIPLVISLGKWRRQVVIPAVPACVPTQLDGVLTRLPRRRSEGDIPRIALATGAFDALECLLRKLGIDDSEFTPEAGGGRVNLFTGHGGGDAYAATLNGGARFTPASDTAGMQNGWWSTLANLRKYDLLLLSCEGQTYLPEKSPAARQALQDYIGGGGRAFASHWHNGWISGGPMPLSQVATFYDSATAKEFAAVTATIDISSEKGRALSDWLAHVDNTSPPGSLAIKNARNTVRSIAPNLTQRLVYYNDPGRGGAAEPQYFSFNAPVGAAPNMQCGRMVFTDIHVSGNDAGSPDPALDLSSPRLPFPTGCVSKGLTAQEKALIFLLFDLAGCVDPIIP